MRGGLGNQLFQYAAGRALALRLGLPLVIDTSWFGARHPRETPRQYGLQAFSLPATLATPEQLNFIAQQYLVQRFGLAPLSEYVWLIPEPFRHYWPAFTRIGGATYLAGLWQSPQYFDCVADVIRSDIVFPPLETDAARAIAQQIAAARTPVSVHVRRGDYLTDPRELRRRPGCCPPAYYRRAIEMLAERHGLLTLFLFSDEPAWLRANFDACGQQAVVVDVPSHTNAAHHDLHLMTLARHHIVANSTFSWWGAWLAQSAGQSVIAPSLWATDLPASGMDRFPPSWVTLSGSGETVPLSYS